MKRVVHAGNATKARLFLNQFPYQQEWIFRHATRLLSTQPTQPITLKTWKSEMVESNGDYRNESFLEDYIGGPLYENQPTLPRLPVPSIQDTIARFLPTALPLAKSKEEEMNLKKACLEFPEQAKVLQERLIARKDGEMKDSSWLQMWWNQVRQIRFRTGQRYEAVIGDLTIPHHFTAWVSAVPRYCCSECFLFLPFY